MNKGKSAIAIRLERIVTLFSTALNEIMCKLNTYNQNKGAIASARQP